MRDRLLGEPREDRESAPSGRLRGAHPPPLRVFLLLGWSIGLLYLAP